MGYNSKIVFGFEPKKWIYARIHFLNRKWSEKCSRTHFLRFRLSPKLVIKPVLHYNLNEKETTLVRSIGITYKNKFRYSNC
jgi:hypothetical protein